MQPTSRSSWRSEVGAIDICETQFVGILHSAAVTPSLGRAGEESEDFVPDIMPSRVRVAGLVVCAPMVMSMLSGVRSWNEDQQSREGKKKKKGTYLVHIARLPREEVDDPIHSRR